MQLRISLTFRIRPIVQLRVSVVLSYLLSVRADILGEKMVHIRMQYI